jgi:aryl-alcohol dehydrogenase-like predicted oxidoreductase
VPIPGTKKLNRMEENLGAVSVDLTSAGLKEIGSTLASLKLEGNRLPDAALSMTGC